MRIAVSMIALLLIASPALADDLSDFQGRYSALKAAMDSREDRDIKKLLAKDFVTTDISGEAKDADDMITELSMIPVMEDMKTEVKLASLAVNGTTATVSVTRDTSFSRKGPDGASHALEMINVSNDTWVQTKGVWLLKTNDTQEMMIKRDGVEMRHFHKGDKIPPRGMRRPGGPGQGPGGDGPPPGPPPGGN